VFPRALTKPASHVPHDAPWCRFPCAGHTCASCVHVRARGWTWIARLPRYRSSSWPPRVMPYPLALHNNLPRRVCSGISARTLLPALLFLSPVRPPFCLLIGAVAVCFVLLLPGLLALRELSAPYEFPPFPPWAICLSTRSTLVDQFIRSLSFTKVKSCLGKCRNGEMVRELYSCKSCSFRKLKQ